MTPVEYRPKATKLVAVEKYLKMEQYAPQWPTHESSTTNYDKQQEI